MRKCVGRLGLALAALVPALASATEGEQVISGEATFTRDGSLLQIDTTTPQTIINWSGGFDIAPGATVQINQPNALSNTLNYDLTTDPSRIEGSLFSNGGVWIINPVGVFFGDQAIVDVGRLVAGGGKVDAGDFLAGTERFTDLTGNVEVAAGAQIRAADSVLLVGAAVANYGNISAAHGMIALVAGGEVRLARTDGRVIVTADRAIAPDPERWAITQAGTLDAGKGSVSLTAGDAYSLAINHTGITRAADIAVAGGDGGIVLAAGALDASDRSAGATGGEIAVTGERIALLGAQLDASGDAGGGAIRVGGDLRGGGDLSTAQRTYVDAHSSLRSDAITTGNGGTIIVWSDEATRFYGALSARGGALGGDGGFAEISGASLEARGSVDLGASAGSAGTLLYDPKEIQLVGGAPVEGSDGSDSPDALPGNLASDGGIAGQIWFGDAGDLSEPFQIYESEIEGTNANVVLEAEHRISSTGTFDNDAAGEGINVLRITDDNSLTMRTRNDTNDATGATNSTAGIDLETVSFETTGTGTITLATGTGIDTGVKADIKVGNLTTAGGAVSVTTEDGDISVGAVKTAGATAVAGGNGGDVTITASHTGSVTVLGAIDASGGNGSGDSDDPDDPDDPVVAGVGGDGGHVAISANAGSITTAGISVSGGNGEGGGRGGNGGTIKLVADLDPGSTAPTGTFSRVITVNGALSAKGGSATGDADDTTAIGGKGGQIGLSAGLLAEGGSILLGGGQIDASGGGGTAGGGSAVTGAIRIEAHEDVTVTADLVASGANTTSDGPGGAGGNGSDISIASAAGNVTFNGSFESEGGTGLATASTAAVNGTGGVATIEGHGDINATLGSANVERFEVIETDVTGSVNVVGGAGVTAHGAVDANDDSVHVISEITTDDTAPQFTYRLADNGGGTTDQFDVTTLRVGNVSLGAQGGTIANAHTDSEDPEKEVLLGRIEGTGVTPHITTAGDLQLFATNIGNATTRLTVNGETDAVPNLEVTVGGDAWLDVGGSIASVDVEKRNVDGDIDIQLPGDGSVQIEGTVEDTGAGLIENSLVHRVDTRLDDTGALGTDFFFNLDTTSDEEPLLTVESGAVRLAAENTAPAPPGGSRDRNLAGFSTTGDLVLEGGTSPAISAGGGGVLLTADSNSDGNGSIIGSRAATDSGLDIEAAGLLIALAGESVGSADEPLHTSADEELLLAGRAKTGGFYLSNSTGDLVVNPLFAAEQEPESLIVVGKVLIGGIQASGDVVLDNDDRNIVMRSVGFVPGEEPPLESVDTVPVTEPHVKTTGSGDQHYVGSIRLESPRRFETTSVDPDTGAPISTITERHEVRLVADGDIVFEGDIDTTPDGLASGGPASLDVSAGGTITFHGDVGSDVGGTPSIDALTLTDARFTAETADCDSGVTPCHTVTVASGDFGAIDSGVDGPGSLVLRGLRLDPEEQSILLFRDDVGAKAALAGFDADADLLVFGTRTDSSGAIVSSADRIVAVNEVALNNHLPVSTITDAATIADTAGGLSIESSDAVTMGAGEKLSVTGALTIHAGGAATLGDLAATDLSVDASQIEIRGRASGLVELPDGTSVADRGVDWVANDIVTNVVPGWDGVGAAPTFVLGDGAIRTGGAIPFDVIRFTSDGDAIRTASFAGHDSRTLDLVGRGTRAVAEATSDVPRASPPVLPGLAARPGDEPPSPPRAVSSEELIGALHCRTAAGDACAPPEVGDDPLASERAIEVRQRYRALFAGDEAQQSLRAAFAPLARVPAGDAAALSRALAHDPALGVARARIADLAVALAQVELLGLDEPESERARRSIAADFAAATGVAGLDADAVLAAVDASGVAVLP